MVRQMCSDWEMFESKGIRKKRYHCSYKRESAASIGLTASRPRPEHCTRVRVNAIEVGARDERLLDTTEPFTVMLCVLNYREINLKE